MDITVKLWSESAFLPLLTLMTLVPLAAMFIILLLDSPRFNRWIGYFSSTVSAMLALFLLHAFDSENTGIQLAEHLAIFGLNYTVGVDGANILYIVLTTFIGLLSLIYVQGSRHANDGQVIAAILGYQTILTGAFSALNALQFWLWSALEILPIAFLTVHAGTGHHRKKAVTLLVQFWGSGLLLSFLGFMLLGFGIEDPDQALNFDWLTLAQNNAPFMNETLIFILLFYGFAVRMPLFPFHAWLPYLAEQGPVAAGLVFVVGLKLGLYAFIRFILPLIPGVADEWARLVVIMGLISVFYGATLALMQINIRRLLAYAVISQTGMLIVGSITFEVSGVEGAILLSLAFGLAAVGLIFSTGFIYERLQTSAMPRLGGLFDSNTALGILFLAATCSTIAMPGTPGFDAAHMLIEGIVEKNGWVIAVVIALGNLLATAFLLWAFQRIFLMDPKHGRSADKPHQSLNQERLITVLICLCLGITGFYSGPWQAIVETATGTIGKYYNIHNSIYENDNGSTYEIETIDQQDAPESDETPEPGENEDSETHSAPNLKLDEDQAPELNHKRSSGSIEKHPALFNTEDV